MKFKLLSLAIAVFTIASIWIFSSEAKAQGGDSITPYAEAIFWAGITSYDDDSAGSLWQGEEGDTDLAFNLCPQTYLGVRGTKNNIFANVAFQAKTPSMDAEEQDQVFLFLAYLAYRIGDFGIMIGQTFTPYSALDSDDVAFMGTAFAWDMMYEYSLFDPARPQIKLDYKGFYIDLIRHTKNEESGVDVVIPMLAAGYQYGTPFTPVSFGIHGLYQTYKIDSAYVEDSTGAYVTNQIDGESIASYAAGVEFNINNMNGFYINTHAHYGVNIGDMDLSGGGNHVSDGTASDKIENTTTYAGRIGIAYETGAVRVAAGIGYKVDSNDTYAEDDPMMTYFASLRYSIQPNFSITPVIQIQDSLKGTNDEEQGKITVVGILAKASI
ncbi:MAG: hypothetical protein JW864_01885 [Spirochaetes bacterium]|nr:hypothetical protein [Spirochaetota bacterium]